MISWIIPPGYHDTKKPWQIGCNTGTRWTFFHPTYVNLKSRVILCQARPNNPTSPEQSGGEVLCEGLRCTDGKFDWRAWERHCFEAWICNGNDGHDWMDGFSFKRWGRIMTSVRNRKHLKGFELREYMNHQVLSLVSGFFFVLVGR